MNKENLILKLQLDKVSDSKLTYASPEISELDCNEVILGGDLTQVDESQGGYFGS